MRISNPPQYVTLEEAQKLKGLTPDDILVHQLIAEAGNLGIWSRDIKLRSNLPQGTIGRIIKNLESKHLIKAVRCSLPPVSPCYWQQWGAAAGPCLLIFVSVFPSDRWRVRTGRSTC